ncbi:Receptor protein kinase [Quillaja saponaria]|uniref:non-specific serine/threonine protein kinase n=1 Tax=Quillaja saponaria TaxID=32244 RepID=A0AAD7QH40_QUISA|nr:Receptor protein kinase [Quillaja saponaria]
MAKLGTFGFDHSFFFLGVVMEYSQRILRISLLLCLIRLGYGATDPGDLKILNDFRKGLENPELLKWPDKGDDPCGSPSWPYVYCSGNRVTQLQAKNLGLKGPLPQNFNQLSELSNLGLQMNKLNGMLPTFSGLSKLEFAFLNENQFDAIPSDFFNGLSNLREFYLDNNPLNASTGWSLPDDLAQSVQLKNLSLMHCNLVGQLPGFLGTLPSLMALKLSFNRLSGQIPATFGQSSMQILWLNDQDGDGMTGPIDVIASMTFLTQLWLHGNQFTGAIPESIGDMTSLKELNLNSNQLVGMIPEGLANLELENLVLNNNKLMGSIPHFKAGTVSYDNNLFCLLDPGLQCAPEVSALLDFLGCLNYPSSLASEWSGNEPCNGSWLGVVCDPRSEVSIINLPRQKLNGTLSPSLAKLGSLVEIRLGANNINGTVPKNLTELKSLRLLDLSENNLEPPLPKFQDSVKVITQGNPLLLANQTGKAPQPVRSPPPIANQTEKAPQSVGSPPPIANQTGKVSQPVRSPPPISSQSPPTRTSPPPSSNTPLPQVKSSNSNPYRRVQVQSQPNNSGRLKKIVIATGIASFAVVLLVIFLSVRCRKKRKDTSDNPSSIVVHHGGLSDPENMVKIAFSNNTKESLSTQTVSSFPSDISSRIDDSHSIEAGNPIIPVQVLRKVTKNFASENELGQGGFGTVYKGELEDGTNIAVKRMEDVATSNKALNEFQAEIAVLSKVRHRHLVSLLGYSVEGNERLLVYEYMPQGALSTHLFHWKTLNLEPLSWTRRLAIALDVARGMEYLHGLARQTFIHRDLKSSNILLGDDFRAKVSDFGLVKLAPDGVKSVATKLAGTFGYLAPEYAVMGKITTKADVFSYGVVLMELLTGFMALDKRRPEESSYLAEWFWQIKSSKETLMASIDPALDATEETFESISLIAELAGHCTARDPNHRPDMSHAVNVLSPLVEKWKPTDEELPGSRNSHWHFTGIDLTKPLPQMLKNWQEDESKDVSNSSFEDSDGSVPVRPNGFAESFTSDDGR